VAYRVYLYFTEPQPEQAIQKSHSTSSRIEHSRGKNEAVAQGRRNQGSPPIDTKQYIQNTVMYTTLVYTDQTTQTPAMLSKNAGHVISVPQQLPSNLPHTPQIVNIKYIHTFPNQHIPNMIPQSQRPSREIPIPNLQATAMCASNLASDDA
jgi:hypothetical protein